MNGASDGGGLSRRRAEVFDELSGERPVDGRSGHGDESMYSSSHDDAVPEAPYRHPRPLRGRVDRHRRFRDPAGPCSAGLHDRHARHPPVRRGPPGHAREGLGRHHRPGHRRAQRPESRSHRIPAPLHAARRRAAPRLLRSHLRGAAGCVAGRGWHLGARRLPARRHGVQPLPGAVHRVAGRARLELRRPHPPALCPGDGADLRDPALRRGRTPAAQPRWRPRTRAT